MVDEVKPKVNRQRDSLKYRLYPLFAITDSNVVESVFWSANQAMLLAIRNSGTLLT